MNSERDQQFQALIRKLVSCQQDAGRLGLIFLGQLLNMAVLETALEWDGGRNAGADPSMRLEKLLNLKIRTALGSGGGNVLALSRPKDPALGEKGGERRT